MQPTGTSDDVFADLESQRSLLRKHTLPQQQVTCRGIATSTKLPSAVDELSGLAANFDGSPAAGYDVQNVYLEPRPKRQQKDNPIKMAIWSKITPTTFLAAFQSAAQDGRMGRENQTCPACGKVRHLNNKKKPDHSRAA